MLPKNGINILAYERIGYAATYLPDGSHNPTTLMVVSSPRHALHPSTSNAGPTREPSPGRMTCPLRAQSGAVPPVVRVSRRCEIAL